MMVFVRCTVSCVVLPLVAFSSSEYERVDDFSEKGEFRAAIECVEHLVEKNQDEAAISKLFLEKAKLLSRDQRQKEAQEIFLEALERCPVLNGRISPEEEAVVYSIFPLYVKASSSEENTNTLEKETRKILEKYPEFLSLKYFLAAVSANKNDFVAFFDQFYQAYMERPDCYLAWKMRGVLHLRIFEASSEEGARLKHRDQAVAFLKKAFSIQPQDASLIAKLIFLLPAEEKKMLLESVSDDISRMEIPMQRSECIYLVREAIEAKSLEVAKG